MNIGFSRLRKFAVLKNDEVLKALKKSSEEPLRDRYYVFIYLFIYSFIQAGLSLQLTH